MKLTAAMKKGITRIGRGEHPAITPGTWRALKDRGLIEYRADGTLLSKLTPEGEELFQALSSDGEETVSRPLTPKMQEALDKISANGGRVGNGLNAFKALGVNGQAANALQRRGLLAVEFDDDNRCWLVIR